MRRPMMKMRVEGLRETMDALKKLPDAIQHQAVSEALAEAVEPMEKAAEALAPHRSGGLQRRIRIGAKPDEKYRVFVVLAATAPHSHLNEFGTGPRYHDNGKYVGEMPAKPFMRPAYDAEKKATITRFKPLVWKAILTAVYDVRVTT